MRLYIGIKNKWVHEQELADLQPARVNALKSLYFDEFRAECPWFDTKRLEPEIAAQLDLQPGEHVDVINIAAAEFIPESKFEEVEELVDSGACTGVATPVLVEAAERLEIYAQSIDVHETSIVQVSESELLFGEFEPGEFDALTRGITDAEVVPELILDFLSDITDKDNVANVICPTQQATYQQFYGNSTLAKLMQYCESSLLVKSLMTKPKVLDARNILRQVRPSVSAFIAKATRLELLEDERTQQLVNSLCDDAFVVSGKRLVNPQTKWKLVSWLHYMRRVYHQGHLSKYLPEELRPRDYQPRAPRTKFKNKN